MNITYIIGVIAAFGVMVVGMMQGGDGGFLTPGQIMNFVDGASVFITKIGRASCRERVSASV